MVQPKVWTLRVLSVAVLGFLGIATVVAYEGAGQGLGAAINWELLWGVALVLALVVLVVGLIATIRRRQFGWLAGLLVGVLLFAGGFVAYNLVWALPPDLYAVPPDAGGPRCASAACPPNFATFVANYALALPAYAPGVVAVVGFLFSFRVPRRARR